MTQAPNKAHPVRDGQATTEVAPENGFTGTRVSGRNQTEQEMVETYIKPADFSVEVTNGRQESDTEADTQLEEPGSEAGQLDTLREAFFASYDVNEFQPEAANAEADELVKIPNPTLYPYSAICALRITAADGTRWIGTGWLVGPRTVIVPGHCVFLHNNGGWAKSIEVIPGFDGEFRPYGSATSSVFRSVNGWVFGKKLEYNYGAIILPATSALGNKTGYLGYAVRDTDFLKSAILNLAGYSNESGLWFTSFKAKNVLSLLFTYETGNDYIQGGAPVWVKIGAQRYCVGIHSRGLVNPKLAIRINQDVFNAIKNWKAEGA